MRLKYFDKCMTRNCKKIKSGNVKNDFIFPCRRNSGAIKIFSIQSCSKLYRMSFSTTSTY